MNYYKTINPITGETMKVYTTEFEFEVCECPDDDIFYSTEYFCYIDGYFHHTEMTYDCYNNFRKVYGQLSDRVRKSYGDINGFIRCCLALQITHN